ncbi:MAG: ATP-binding protein [Chitinophagales bacterium]|nr:ATP-binding protein [Chitinophagales bacterium]
MFIQFSVGNYLSFKDTATFSMVGYAPIKEHESETASINVFYDSTEKLKLLKSSVFYGANGSGKSNMVSAIGFFRNFILTSSNEKQADDIINVIQFLLSSETDDKPSFFEMIFYINNIRYRFGFEADQEKIHAEWLFSLNQAISVKESKLYTREFQKISINRQSFKEGKGLESKTRPNALFLSTVAQLNGEIATKILKWFKTDFNIVSGLQNHTTSYTVAKFQKDIEFKKTVIEFFKSIQIGFDDIEIVEENNILGKSLSIVPDELSEEVDNVILALRSLQAKARKSENVDSDTKQISINTFHKKYNNIEEFVEYAIIDFGLESKGTRKLFSLLGPIIDTIRNGKILIVDELDSQLHTLLTMELIKFFHSKANKKAQLIFASHDTNLLRKDIFRRDQIWFTEKNKIGATELYSLVEYKINQATVRNDASFEKDYLLGKYGAIPFLGDINKFKNDFLDEQEEQ